MREVEDFRQICREKWPVESKFSRFDLLDSNPEDVRALLRVAVKGDVIDLGFCASSSFDVLYGMISLGLHRVLLGNENFIAGIVYIHPVRHIAVPEASLPIVESDPIAQRVAMALAGNTENVRMRGKDDAGVLRWYAEVFIPDPTLCAYVEEGKMSQAREHWLQWVRDSGALPVREAALIDVKRGVLDPKDFEQAFGPIQWDRAIRDRALQGYEIVFDSTNDCDCL